MSVEIQWTERDDTSGARTFIRVRRFARVWQFQQRRARRELWQAIAVPTVAMLEDLLEALERRLPRREGVTAEDTAQVKSLLHAARVRKAAAPPTAVVTPIAPPSAGQL